MVRKNSKYIKIELLRKCRICRSLLSDFVSFRFFFLFEEEVVFIYKCIHVAHQRNKRREKSK